MPQEIESYYRDDRVTVFHGDCREVMAAMESESIDAIVTDPPYELKFMGKGWDGSGIAYDPAVWGECLRVLKPGGHLLAFGGTRTWHRLAVAIEDAGFEVRDSIAWMYGSGFPKSLDVSKAIDKRGGYPHLASEIGRALKAARLARGLSTSEADRQFCGGTTNWTWFEGRPKGQRAPTMQTFAAIVEAWPELADLADKVAEAEREVVGKYETDMGGLGGQRLGTAGGDITAPATPAAQQWQGWGTALKPAFEPVVVARKPLIGTVAENVLAHGTGALNIDGCRIGYASDADKDSAQALADLRARGRRLGVLGEAGQGQSLAVAKSGDTRDGTEQVTQHGAGRWPANVILDESQAAELDRQSGVLHSQDPQTRVSRSKRTGVTQMGTGASVEYGDTGGASRFFYVPKANRRERPNVDGVAHPTVKPLALMRYLINLVTPPEGTVLDPFTGSGATIEAAILEGKQSIGIELTDEYLPLIRERISRQTDGKLL